MSDKKNNRKKGFYNPFQFYLNLNIKLYYKTILQSTPPPPPPPHTLPPPPHLWS
jgi:hypothetical protein